MYHYQDNFYETKQIIAYDIGSFIANIGGYIGMFLRYALLNLPHLFTILNESTKRGICEIGGFQFINGKNNTTKNLEGVSESLDKIEKYK